MFQKWLNKLSRFLTLIRWNEYQDRRIPLTFIVIFYLQYRFQILGSGSQVYLKLFFSLLFSLCYYAYLFTVNDYFDYEQDLRAGKKNESKRHQYIKIYILAFLIAGIISLGIVWQGYSGIPLLTLILGFGLAYFYSAPKLRFKEKGFWGILIGSLVLRPLAIIILVSGLTTPNQFVEISLILAWLEMFSIRSMSYHQIYDYAGDKKAGIKTLVTDRGVDAAKKLIVRIIFPLEILTFAAVIVLFVIKIYSAIYFLIFYGIYRAILFWMKKPQKSTLPFSFGPIFMDLNLLLLPLYLSILVAAKDSLWLVPAFVIIWQRRYLGILIGDSV